MANVDSVYLLAAIVAASLTLYFAMVPRRPAMALLLAVVGAVVIPVDSLRGAWAGAFGVVLCVYAVRRMR